MTIGIYKITCTDNNRFYIGSGKIMEKRWRRHKDDLRLGKHGNIHMQRAYNKYGTSSFVYEIVETLDDKADLLDVEQFYLDHLQPSFNIGKQASGGDNLTNHPNRDAIIKKIGDGVRKRMQDPSVRKHYSDMFQGSGKPNWKNNSVKRNTTCQCGNQKAYGAKVCELCLDRCKDNNPFYGKSHSKETRHKMSFKKHDAFKRMTPEEKYALNPQTRKVVIDNSVYYGVSEAARRLGVCPATIIHRIKSKNKKFEYYFYDD